MKKLLISILFVLVCPALALKITSDANGPVYLSEKQLSVGSAAPQVTLVTGDYKIRTIGGATGKVQIISSIESLNTSVCDSQTMYLSKVAKSLPNVDISVVTTNQPFVIAAFQSQHKTPGISILSAFNDPAFGNAYGVQVVGGQLMGITARSIFVVSKDGKIVYKEITENIDKMPNMEAAIEAAKKANLSK